MKDVEKYLAMSVDCNGVYCYLDPYEGGKIAVAESARNIACSGGVPLGTTDNLNFGNPHNPELFWQLKEAVRGLAEGCTAFDAPVTGGNVSLYNQNPTRAIDPTPTIAMVGIIEKPEHITTQWFKNEGDVIILLGAPVGADKLGGLGGSAFLQVEHKTKNGSPSPVDFEVEKRLHTTLRSFIDLGDVKSAHDCSEGGLLVAIAESCISGQTARGEHHLIGADIDLSNISSDRLDALLYGEAQSRIVISVPELEAAKVEDRAKAIGVPAITLGRVGGNDLKLKTSKSETSWPVSELHALWYNAIAKAMA